MSADNTNAKHLELYSIMGEYDNAGFPLSYCLLSTATAIDQGKRTKSLSAWATCVRDQYDIDIEFAHVDKDMAEIGTLKVIWNKAKISLCWWHLRRAVRTRLAKAKLSTTPYDVKRACAEFNFIDAEFVPARTRVDKEDYEGGLPGDETTMPYVNSALHLLPEPYSSSTAPKPLGKATNTLRITLPWTQLPTNASHSTCNGRDKENSIATPCNTGPTTQVKRVVLLLPPQPPENIETIEISDGEDNSNPD